METTKMPDTISAAEESSNSGDSTFDRLRRERLQENETGQRLPHADPPLSPAARLGAPPNPRPGGTVPTNGFVLPKLHRKRQQMTKRILEHFSSLKSLQETQIKEADLFGGDHKRTREWLTLGAAVACMKTYGWKHPETAIETEPPDPDFKTFMENGAVWKDVEITECLPTGYKRHDFYRLSEDERSRRVRKLNSDSFEAAFATLKRRLLEKSKMEYAPQSAIIVYFNIGVYENKGRIIDALDEIESQKNFLHLDSIRFANIFILSCAMDKLIQLK